MIHRLRDLEDVEWGCVTILQNPEGKALMIKDGDGKWSFPYMQVGAGEAPIDTVGRIFKDVVGLAVYDVKFLCTYYNEPYLEYMFLGKRFSGTLNIPETGYMWEHMWFLANYDLTEASRKTLEEYYKKHNA